MKTIVKPTTISRSKAREIIKNSKGRFITTTHITKKGESRTMNCRYKNETSLGKLRVVENGAYKGVNTDTLTDLKANKQVYKVK